jgi:hypothetical protein
VRQGVTIRHALNDRNLLGDILQGASWRAWEILQIALMGEALTDDERSFFKDLTGRVREPGARVEEFVGVIGRRGGKSRAISVLATYLAGCCHYPTLVPGERGALLRIAADQRQAGIVLDYIEANFKQSPILAQLVESQVAGALRLNNNIDIEVRASEFRRLRGPTYIAVIADECAFYQTDGFSSNPDTEILGAVRPGLATTAGLLVMISSPYARKGELWDAYRRHYGVQGDPLVLVAQGASKQFNPTLPQSVVDRAMARDPAHASAEYLAQFRTDIENFVSLEAVQACVSRGVRERDPRSGVTYHAFCDPSGGSADSMCLAIGHRDRAKLTVVVDCLREVRPPFSPEGVCNEFAETLRSYNLTIVTGDRYAGLWPTEQFGKFNVTYHAAAKPKSELYLELLPLINSRRIELLDHPRALNQLLGLERRTARGGRDSIDHSPGQHDDIANVIAGIASFNTKFGNYDPTYSGWDDAPPDGKGPDYLMQRLADYMLS